MARGRKKKIDVAEVSDNKETNAVNIAKPEFDKVESEPKMLKEKDVQDLEEAEKIILEKKEKVIKHRSNIEADVIFLENCKLVMHGKEYDYKAGQVASLSPTISEKLIGMYKIL